MGYRTEVRIEPRETMVIVGATCDECGEEIPSGEDEDSLCGYKPDRALPVVLIGGYWYYFDCDDDPRVLLCKNCAKRLCETFKSFGGAIDRAYG